MIRILGLDPGLRHTGWGIVEKDGTRLRFIAGGVINPSETGALSERLAELHQELKKIIEAYQPDEAAVEQTFVNNNPTTGRNRCAGCREPRRRCKLKNTEADL